VRTLFDFVITGQGIDAAHWLGTPAGPHPGTPPPQPA
jgi:hypothetical protein